MTLQERSAVYKFATGSSRVATSEEFEQSVCDGFVCCACSLCSVFVGCVTYLGS